MSRIDNLPTYLPPVTVAEAAGDDQFRLHGEIPNCGSFDGQGYYRVNRAERRMEYGANVEHDYFGQLWVSEQGAGSSEITVEIWFGSRSVDQEVQQAAGPDRNAAHEALAATLKLIRRQIKGENGKLMPPPPPQERRAANQADTEHTRECARCSMGEATRHRRQCGWIQSRDDGDGAALAAAFWRSLGSTPGC